jgi:hypothetical protein
VLVRNRFTLNESMQSVFAPPVIQKTENSRLYIRILTAVQELALIGPEEYEVDNMQITRKTNIWQIGMVITCMMRLEVYLP